MEPTSPFHTETPHYRCNEGSPLPHDLFVKVAPVSQFTQQASAVDPKELWHNTSWHLHVFFYAFPPVNLNMYPLTVYNHMNAVIMCWVWDPDPPNILKSEKFFSLSRLHNYLKTGKQDAVWLCHSWGGRLFSGGKFTEPGDGHRFSVEKVMKSQDDRQGGRQENRGFFW